MSNRYSKFVAALVMTVTTAAALADPFVQPSDVMVEQATAFGINRDTGMLWRYDIGGGTLTEVGVVHDSDGNAMVGVDASTYIDGFHQIHAFWKNPVTDHWMMILIDPETAEATVSNVDLGSGRVTGAVGFAWEDLDLVGSGQPTMRYTVYVVQNTTAETANNGVPGLAGKININPNNSPDNEFILTMENGSQITRDDLHEDSPVTADGTYYEGKCTYIRIKPKGNGNQNGLTINGELWPLSNGTTYQFYSSNMDVRVFNDKYKNGKAMGHWWVEVNTLTCTISYSGQTVQVSGPTSRMVEIDTRLGAVNQMMQFTRTYDSLASYDGNIFFATSGKNFYRINRGALMETTLVSNSSMNSTYGLEYCGPVLMGFENVNNHLTAIDPATGQPAGSPIYSGMSNLGTIVFVKTSQAPSRSLSAVD